MYTIKEGLVSRDIGGIYFIVDIYDGFCFDTQRLYSVNLTGKTIFDIMNRKKNFGLEDVIDEFIPLLVNYNDNMRERIENDTIKFVEDMIELKYVSEE